VDAIGRYPIERVLGSGAFASVWLGRDERLDSYVAIKVLADNWAAESAVRERFLKEARLLRQADSPRIVQVHDIGELPDGRPYFVMTYADMGSLAGRVLDGPLPVPEALRVLGEIAEGVAVLHRLGIVHRDLKPSNVLFRALPGGGERLMVADLGVARSLADATSHTIAAGSPGYMAPEQMRLDGAPDERADVHGLGAMAYHLLTGQLPATGSVRLAPHRLRPEVPVRVGAAVMKAIDPDPDRRWPSITAFADALLHPDTDAVLHPDTDTPPAPSTDTHPAPAVDPHSAPAAGSSEATSTPAARSGPDAGAQLPSSPPDAGEPPAPLAALAGGGPAAGEAPEADDGRPGARPPDMSPASSAPGDLSPHDAEHPGAGRGPHDAEHPSTGRGPHGDGHAGAGRGKAVAIGAGAAALALAVVIAVLALRPDDGTSTATGTRPGSTAQAKPGSQNVPAQTGAANASRTASPRPGMGLRADADIPKKYRALIIQAGTWCDNVEGLSPALVAGVLKMASDFDPNLSDPAADEYGIARWTPRVLRFWQPNGLNDPVPTPPFSPELSLPAMGRFFCTLGPQVAGVPADPAAKLAALYVTGVQPVTRDRGVPPKWKKHVEQVLKYRDQYQE
jgi:serine/threonine protein kinase